MFCATNGCVYSDSKEWHFLLKMDDNLIFFKCDTNKNVTKMDVIIKGALLYDIW
jgi:hypothetical protein